MTLTTPEPRRMTHPPRPAPSESQPPAFLAARVVQRYAEDSTASAAAARRVLAVHARRARAEGDRSAAQRICDLGRDVRRIEQRREARAARATIATLRAQDAQDAALTRPALSRPTPRPALPTGPTARELDQRRRIQPEQPAPAPTGPTGVQLAGLRQAQEARAATTQARSLRRRCKPSPREVTQALTLPREQHREARHYAQAWYDALRLWDTYETVLDGTFRYEDYGRPADMTLLGSNRPAPVVYLRLPDGDYDEGSVGLAITQMMREGTPETQALGRLLDKLRHERSVCPASLLREDGTWERHRESVTRYAVAVLTLAVRLRVAAAEKPLAAVQHELSRLAHS